MNWRRYSARFLGAFLAGVVTTFGVFLVTQRVSLADASSRAQLMRPERVSASTSSPTRGFFAAVRSGLSVLSSHILKVSSVELQGAVRVQQAFILELAGLTSPKYFWDVRAGEVEAKLKEDPWIEDVTLSWRYYPLTLVVKIREADPWLVAHMGGQSWLISSEGRPLEPLETLRNSEVIVEASQLPRLDGLESGDSTENARFRYAMNILRFIEVAGGLPFAVERYTVLPEGGVLALPLAGSDLPEVAFSAETLPEAEHALSQLNVVLADLKKRGEKRNRVDMRFRGQAVVR